MFVWKNVVSSSFPCTAMESAIACNSICDIPLVFASAATTFPAAISFKNACEASRGADVAAITTPNVAKITPQNIVHATKLTTPNIPPTIAIHRPVTPGFLVFTKPMIPNKTANTPLKNGMHPSTPNIKLHNADLLIRFAGKLTTASLIFLSFSKNFSRGF